MSAILSMPPCVNGSLVPWQVGEDQYIQPLLSLTFQMKMTDDAYTAMVISGLECKHVDVTLATLAYLKERLQEPERGSCQESWESVQVSTLELPCDILESLVISAKYKCLQLGMHACGDSSVERLSFWNKQQYDAGLHTSV